MRNGFSLVRRLLVLLMALALFATACGSSDSTDDAATTDDSSQSSTDSDSSDSSASGDDDGDGEEPEAEEAMDDEDSMDEEDSMDDEDSMDEEDSMDDEDSMDEMADMAPVYGGELTYLLEAESDTWEIPGANCAVSCITVMRAVADPMMIVNADGVAEPFLLESLEANDDFTMYTLTMREGVTFHDGTPADGAAVHRSLTEMASGLLQGQVFVDLKDGIDSIVLVDDMTVTVEWAVPNSVFGLVLSERTGWLIAPSYWDDPERAGALMIATGPFQMTEWVRNEQTVVERNENYWRTADGAELPYLDRVVFRPNPDVSARRATMEAGDADVNIDSFGENREFWNNDWVNDGGNLLVPADPRETTYLMFNNSKPPFDNVEMRRALTLCTDRDEYLAFRAPGNELANGPFAKGDLGYIEDPGFPSFDPDAGNALLDEIGRPEEIVYGTTNVPSNLLTAELFADMWATNCGLTVNIDQFDQSELITKAITGQFEVFLWRNHGQGHPGLELIWWHSRHAVGLALNFGRIVDPEMDAALMRTLTTTDPAELDAFAQDVNTLFADNVYNMWLNTTEWATPYQSDVHGIGHMTLDSGNVAQTSVAGRVWVQEAWVEGG